MEFKCFIKRYYLVFVWNVEKEQEIHNMVDYAKYDDPDECVVLMINLCLPEDGSDICEEQSIYDPDGNVKIIVISGINGQNYNEYNDINGVRDENKHHYQLVNQRHHQ